MKKYNNDKDILFDNEFIAWRLSRAEEQDLYWKQFADEHPESREKLDRAIRKFDAIKFNHYQLPESPEEQLFLRKLFDFYHRRTRRRKIIYWSAAASIALLMVSSLIFILPNIRSTKQELPGMEAIVGQAMQSDEIRLISGEEVVELKQNAQITVNDKQISVTEESNVSEISLPENMMHKLIVPPGKRSTLQLSDGSKIWLNSGTELDFPSKFAGSTREITVRGEIYIEVAEGQKPFYVNTSLFRVRVHGTKFNISTYGENEENTVVLVEGSVEVIAAGYEPTWLSPNEKAEISMNKILTETVNVDEYIGWKDSVLIFNKMPFLKVLKKIGRYYNVNFEDHSDEKLSAKICTGKLFLSENFEYVILTLSTLSGTQYRKEGDVIYLTEK